MIAQFKPSTGWPVLALGLVTLLGCVSLTDAKKQNGGAVNRSGADPGVTAVSGRMNAQPVVRLVASDKIDRWVAYGDSYVSPNGKYLTYVNWTHGNLAFYNIETGELRDLTSEGTWSGNPDQWADSAIWSPDTTQIAYLWRTGTNGAIRIIHREGGKSRVLVPANLLPQGWTKDGKHIIALGPYRNPTPNSPQIPEGIVRVEVSTGRTSMIKQLPNANQWTSLALSPDGKYIAYSYPHKSDISTNATQNDLRIVNVDGANDHSLIEHPADDSSPQWLPNGKHLLFLSDRSGSVGIWALPISSGQPAGEARIVRESVEGRFRQFRITDDGSVHYFTRSPSFNIYVAEANFDEAKIGTPKLVSFRYEGRNRTPHWSSDGSKLGYISWRDPAFLVFQDLTTGKEEEVKTEWLAGESGDRPPGWWPVWSPDLGRLVGPAGSANKRGRSLVQVGRRSTVEEVGAVDCWMSVFTPDGKYLIYNRGVRHPKGPGLFELNLATKEERVISQKSEFGVISPDGLRMTECRVPYPAKVGDTTKLVVTSRTDGAVKTIAEFPITGKDSGAGFCDWLPDNRRVIISIEANESDQLYLVDTETGSSRPIDLPLPKGEGIRNLTVHPDGKRIAFERGRMIREMWSIKNFFPEEKLAAK